MSRRISLFLFLLGASHLCFAQQTSRFIEVGYLYGSILEHNPDISHLITGHPNGVMLSYTKRTDGQAAWHKAYGYPEVGLAMTYQDMGNPVLGQAIAVYAQIRFFAWQRRISYGGGTGIAYMTNPYDPVTNFRNVAYGTPLTSATFLNLAYRQNQVFKNIGVHAGVTLIHYSNGNFKEPNTSTNSFMLHAGVHVQMDGVTRFKNNSVSYQSDKWRLNMVLRHGWNESNVRGSGVFPFGTFSAYTDKRLSLKNSLHLGLDVMYTAFLKEYRDYLVNSFSSSDLEGSESLWRIGAFVGHELHFGKTSIITQIGYYLKDEIKYGASWYNRIGLQHRCNKKLFLSLSLKSHAASAEGLSIGVGYRI